MIYDYLNEAKEPPKEGGVIGGMAAALGAAAAPAPLQTALNSGPAIKRVADSFLGRLSTQSNGGPSLDWRTRCCKHSVNYSPRQTPVLT